MSPHTITPEEHARRRIAAALDNRGVALVVADDDERRAAYLHDLRDSLVINDEHTPVIVRTPDTNTDAAFLRALSAALDLRQTRTRMPMWRELTKRAEACYAEGRRLLLVVDDLHRATPAHFDVLHSLTTVTVGHDLAIGIILAGRTGLLARLAEERHRALRSRVSATLRLDDLES